MNITVLSLCAALAVASLAAPAKAQRPEDFGGNGQGGSNTTHTQSIQDCEKLTNQPGGNPGRRNGGTTDQNPLTHSTMQPPTRLTAGNYSVHSAAWTYNGDTNAGWARIYILGGGAVSIQTPSGRTNLIYVCTGRSGMVYYRYGNQDQNIGFNLLPGTTGLRVYDVWWLHAKADGTNAVETWNYESPLSR